MYQYQNIEDTIVAITTPSGFGAIGIVRLSGQQSIALASKIIQLKSKKLVENMKSHEVCLGWVSRAGSIVDEVLVTVMRAPKSYTTEDIVEISCHGGHISLRAVLQLCCDSGARLASPGEFTKRAFLNGRIDLTQAEAVLDVIQAKTQAFLRVSTNQLTGELSKEIAFIREGLMSVYIMIEAVINFPEDDIDPEGRQQIIDRIQDQSKRLKTLLDSSQDGRLLKEGIRIVLCGKPNVGKSSLLNVLLKQQRAIVTDIAGTTRDVLEESTQINGMYLQLVDTAGILEPRDLVEVEAVKRSHMYIKSADLVLLVLDTSRPLDDADSILFKTLFERNVLVVKNKRDLTLAMDETKIPFNNQVSVSAHTKEAIDTLESAIVTTVMKGHSIDPHALLVSNIRHIQALTQGHVYLKEALEVMETQGAWEVISDNIKQTVNSLDAITGRNIDTDLIDRIFSEFCIGK